MTVLADLADQLGSSHLARIPWTFSCTADAWDAAVAVASQAADAQEWCRAFPRLEVVGEFSLPPAGTLQRDFQALHIDFGLPASAMDRSAIARFTALYREPGCSDSDAATRFVSLRRLHDVRAWPATRAPSVGSEGSIESPRTVEGILARLIEDADRCPDLPAQDEAYLCGMEFGSLEEERQYFSRHQISLDDLESEIVLRRGELLIFDNLAVAHGRRGVRQPGELSQLCLGHHHLDASQRRTLARRSRALFTTND